MDQITGKTVYSQEANEEADRIMKSLTNVLGIDGENIRQSSLECIDTLYSMTMWKNPNEKFDTR